MRANEMTFPHVVNGRPVTVWVEAESSHPKDISVTGATDDETDEEVELSDADKQSFHDKVYDMLCGE